MQLVINTFGSYLRKNGECFVVKTDDQVFEISARKIESILISTSAYLSTDALKLAMENNIDVVFLDEYGSPFGRVWHSKLGSTVRIRRKQLEISAGEEGFEFAKDWINRKIENQILLLKELKKPRKEKSEAIDSAIATIEEKRKNLQALTGIVEEKRGLVMACEGAAGKVYFETLSLIMPEKFQFQGRSRNPAKDEFNAFLNYGYGVLYSMVEKACIIAGLDPYIGFLHADNYNKKSLVFDLIEMYRVYAEETVVHLFSGRKVKSEHLDRVHGGFTLNKEGKALLLEALNNYLDQQIRYRGRNVQRRHIIQLECHRIADDLIK